MHFILCSRTSFLSMSARTHTPRIRPPSAGAALEDSDLSLCFVLDGGNELLMGDFPALLSRGYRRRLVILSVAAYEVVVGSYRNGTTLVGLE